MSPPPQPPAPHPSQSEPYFQEQVAAMARHLETVRDLPGLGHFKESGAMPAAFFEHLDAALACYDRLIDFVLGYDGTDEQITCRKGCCNCCIDLVRGITTPEIINIYHHVRAWPEVKQVFEYHRDSAEMFMDILLSKMQPGEPPPRGDDPRLKEAHVEFNRRNRPCGFLDQETGCCRIYPVRPIACRYFFNLDPPEHCSPLHERYLSRDTRTVHLPPEIHELLLEITRRIGLRTLNYLSGGFCAFAAEVMRTRPINVVVDGEAGQ
jgi:Fe-S-cluster containining protein